MNKWNGASAVVTGAASGIGLALSEALIARGADVWLTDINGSGAQEAAQKLGTKAHAAQLDVRDARGVQAVVGLSVSLRLEAENFGVRISALCPAAIDTPLLDTDAPNDLPKPWMPNIRRYLARFGSPAFPVAKLAEEALRGVERNRAVIVVPATGRIAVLLYRIVPGLLLSQTRRALAAELSEKPGPGK